jgi:hypothetical protein
MDDFTPPGGQPDPATTGAMRASHSDRDRVAEVIRLAAGDGRLSETELEERLEAVYAARTNGELAALIADLTGQPRAKDVIRLSPHSGGVTRTGRWVVPRRLEIHTSYNGHIRLDFTEAVIVRDSLQLNITQDSVGSVTLIIRPGIVVDVDDVHVKTGGIHSHTDADPSDMVLLHIKVTGEVHKNIVVVMRRPKASTRAVTTAVKAADWLRSRRRR